MARAEEAFGEAFGEAQEEGVEEAFGGGRDAL